MKHAYFSAGCNSNSRNLSLIAPTGTSKELTLALAILTAVVMPLLPISGEASTALWAHSLQSGRAHPSSQLPREIDPAYRAPQDLTGTSYVAPLAGATSSRRWFPLSPPPPSAYATTVQGDSPVAYWRLDDSSGSTMADAIGTDPGTYQGGYTLGQSPLIGPANGTSVSFDGSSGYASASDLTALQSANSRSVELWFQTSYTGAQPLFDVGSTSLYSWMNINLTGNGTLVNPPINTPGLDVSFYGEGCYIPSLNLGDSKRHHVVVTVSSGTSFRIYVDGATPQAICAVPGSGWATRHPTPQPFTIPNTLTTSNNPIWLGQSRDSSVGTFFHGRLDEVAIYSSVLTATQVQNHWQAGNGLPWAPTSVSGTAGTNLVTVSWTAPTFNGTGISGYVVTPHVGNVIHTPITFSSTATTENIGSLSGATAYTFTVNGVNALGVGIASDPSSSVTPTGPGFPNYEDTVLADSPIGFWSLGDNSGTAATDLVQTDNGVYNGSYTQGQVGGLLHPTNLATLFSGSNVGEADLGNPSSLAPTSFSVEAWVKPNDATNMSGAILVGPGSGNDENNIVTAYRLVPDHDSQRLQLKFTNPPAGGNDYIRASTPMTSGQWQYVVATDDGSSARIYVNGVFQGATGALTPNYGGAITFEAQIGRLGFGSTFPGTIADVAVYGTALSPAQVAAHWAAAGYAPGPVSNLVATASTNSASLTWTPPAYIGTSTITSYTITPNVDGKTSTPINVNGPNTGANIPNLAGGASYSFQVQANNASGGGVGVISTAVSINSPSAGPGGFGTYLLIKGGQGNGQAYEHYGFVSRNNVPSLSAWTFEARLWGFNSLSTTGGHAAVGFLSGTTSNPSDQNPVAGLNFNLGGSPLQTLFVWPGGSCTLTSDSQGVASAFDAQVTTPAHVALSYDGASVRGFINGTQVCSQATGSGALAAGPFGYMDNAGLSQAYFDEIRVSSVARYTANFTPPIQQFVTDGSTNLLWHFNDYGIAKLPVIDIPSNLTDGSGFKVNIIPSTYRDASGNINHANTIWQSGASSGSGDDFRRPYSLGQGVTADELTGGGSPWLCPCTISSTASPINDATGEFWHTFTDFHIPGRVPLDFTRTYSSLHAAVQSPIGFGWTDNYNEYLSFNGSGNATVHADNGSAVIFTFTSPSTYTPPPSEHVTLVKNGDQSFTLTDKGQNQIVFNPQSGNTSTLQKLVDRHGGAAYTTTLTYNGDGTLQRATDPAGRTLTFAYSVVGTNKLITITDTASPARSVILQIGNDSSQPATYQDLTQVTDVAGGLTKFTYDSNHYLQTMTDPNNGITTNTYDASTHQITNQQDPLHRNTTFSYSGGITTVTDPKANITKEEYLNGMLLSRTRGYGTSQQATWTYAYDASALGVTAVVGPNGETSTSVRDSNANVLSSTDGLGRVTTYTYNSFSEPLTVTDPLQVTTTNTYSATGDLKTTSRPLVGTSQTATTTYSYTDSAHLGDVTGMTDADSNAWVYTYDAYGNRISSTDPLTDKTTYFFDNIGRMTSMVTPKGNVTGGNPSLFTWTYTYDAFGNRTSVTDPLNDKTTYHYDPNQNLDVMTDANTNVTTNVYDLDNQLTQVKRADSPQTTLTTDYNADGTVLDQKDGKGNAIMIYAYDSLARVTSMTDALNNATTYAYDGNGNQLTKQNPGGNCGATPPTGCTTNTYDAANQLLAITYSDGVTPNVSNTTYDSDGQRTGVTDGTGTSTWTWDSLHRVVSYVNGNGAQVQWAYNLRNLPTTITYPGSLNVTRGYDNAGRWTSVQDWNTNTTTFGYDADSNLTTETFPATSGVVDTFTFNAADQLTASASTKSGTTLFSAGYTRDAANQLSSDTSASTGTGSYKYTPLNQVCYAGSSSSNACSSPPTGSIPYKYDAADNLTQAGSTQQVFNNADELCWTASTTGSCASPPSGATTYQYDNRGNRTVVTPSPGQAQTLTYDQANRLTKYVAATTTTYAYNADGLRMSKNAGATTLYLWDGAGELPLLLKDGSTAYIYGPGNVPLEQINGSTTYYSHHDQLGSTRLLTDSVGAVLATYTFDAFGNLTSTTGSITNPFRFAGQYQDPESGLYYLRARYYDAGTGQFVSQDPLLAATLQPYSYAAGNPLNNTDPAGLCWPSWACTAENFVGRAKDAAVHWATTPQDLPSPDLFTAPINFGYGLYKLVVGVGSVVVGVGADLSIAGIPIGIPANVYGGYQIITGCARIYRAYKQETRGVKHPRVKKSPLQYGVDVGANLAPGGSGIEDLLGGLP